jgi:biopolymer transport protein ExbB
MICWPLVAWAQTTPAVTPPRELDAPSAASAAEAPRDDAPAAAGSTQRSLITFFKDGGALMYPILGCSIIMVLFTFERMISLRRRRIIHKPFVKQFLHQLREGKFDREEALEFCEKNHSVIAGVCAAAVRKWGRPAVEVEQAILDAGERAANSMRRNLRLLNGVATISPLLGLLGTVLGMITSFNEIAHADAMGRPEQLAGGIGVALLTTAFGLTVAIPALISYMYFLSRVDRLVMDIDALGQEVVAEICAEELADRPRGRKKAA